MSEIDESGTLEEQAKFMQEVERFYRDNDLEFKAPKFYGEPVNCLKLWRTVSRLGGYEMVTSQKLWRQVGESFDPPKTCTTVSWTFRILYEKALLQYEKYKRKTNENILSALAPSQLESAQNKLSFSTSSTQASGSQVLATGRARRDAATRAMQIWHQSLFGNDDVTKPTYKETSSSSKGRREKIIKDSGLPGTKAVVSMKRSKRPRQTETNKELTVDVTDVGSPADWVKITVREKKDCFEIYALIPGLLRDEVRVQSDPTGRVLISGQPEKVDNPWGISPFKKVVALPGRINSLQTIAVINMHGRLFVHAPFEQGSA